MWSTRQGHTDAYRWDDFLGIAGGHVYSAMDTIDMVSTGGQYEGDEPEHAYACEIVGCCGLSDGVAQRLLSFAAVRWRLFPFGKGRSR